MFIRRISQLVLDTTPPLGEYENNLSATQLNVYE